MGIKRAVVFGSRAETGMPLPDWSEWSDIRPCCRGAWRTDDVVVDKAKSEAPAEMGLLQDWGTLAERQTGGCAEDMKHMACADDTRPCGP